MATKNVGTGATSFDITYSLSDGCAGAVSFSSDSSWLTLDSKTSSPRTVTVAQNDGSARTGYITPSYNGSPCDDKKIQVNQSGQTVDLCPSVDCSGCGYGKSATDTSHTITWSIPRGSVSNLSISNSSTTLTNLNITVNASSVGFTFGQNTDTTDEKSFNADASFTVTSGEVTTSCTVTNFGFTQAAAVITCDCSDLTLGTYPSEWPYDDTSSKNVSLSSGSCITDIVLTNPSHFTATLGSNNISIKPNDENTGTSAYEENVIVNYKANGGNCTQKQILVKQNPNSCSTAECTCYKVSTATATTALSSDTAATVEWSYTAVTWTTGSTCQVTSSKTYGSSSTTVTFDQNTGETACENVTRNGSFTWSGYKECGSNDCGSNDVEVSWEVVQGRGKPERECTQCECYDITLKTRQVSIGATANSTTSVTYTQGECSGTLSATTSKTWLEVVSVGDGNINLKATETNTGSTRTATVTITLNGSECSSKTIEVTQGVHCDCSDLTLGTYPSEWPYDDTSSKNVSLSSGSCITDIVLTNPSHFTATLGRNNISIEPNDENTGTSAYEENVIVNYKANGSSCGQIEIPVKQNANSCPTAECTCYIVGEATAATMASSSDTSATVEWSYTAVTWTTGATCQVTSSETYGSSSTTVTFDQNTGETACDDVLRTGNFTWNGHKACGSNDCGSNDVEVSWEVVQGRGKPERECTQCECNDITLETSQVSIGATANSTTSVTYEQGECSGAWSATTSKSWLEVVSVGGGNINLKATETNTGSTRTATVTITLNGSECSSKTIEVTQGVHCDCNAITSFTITATSLTADAVSTPTEIGTYRLNSECGDNVSVSSDASWINVSANGGKIYATWEENSSTANTRTATITAKWDDAECSTKSDTVTQDKGSCPSYTINPSGGSGSGGTVTFTVS